MADECPRRRPVQLAAILAAIEGRDDSGLASFSRCCRKGGSKIEHGCQGPAADGRASSLDQEVGCFEWLCVVVSFFVPSPGLPVRREDRPVASASSRDHLVVPGLGHRGSPKYVGVSTIFCGLAVHLIHFPSQFPFVSRLVIFLLSVVLDHDGHQCQPVRAGHGSHHSCRSFEAVSLRALRGGTTRRISV